MDVVWRSLTRCTDYICLYYGCTTLAHDCAERRMLDYAKLVRTPFSDYSEPFVKSLASCIKALLNKNLVAINQALYSLILLGS